MPYVLLTAAAAVLLYRCFFSFVWSDESFYLSLVHRFWAGDAPIVDEWSGVQFYAVILLPVYSLYRLLVGSSDGVYLFFRILAVVSQYCCIRGQISTELPITASHFCFLPGRFF